MKKKHKILKILGIVAASITGFCVLCHGALMTWINVANDNDLPLFIQNGFKSVFFNDNKEDKNVDDFKEKTGGVMRGVCHPHYEKETLLKLEEANINWVRYDIPQNCPLELDENHNPIIKNGEYVLSWSLNNFIKDTAYFKSFNQKLMIITPGIDEMLRYVGEEDVFTYGGEFSEKFINFSRACAKVFAEKLGPIAGAFQICNETEIPKWRGALTTDQVVYFIGDVMMKEMHDTCAQYNCVLGFNQSMLGNYELANKLTTNYGQYFDYVGVDLYPGCFEPYTKVMAINDFYVKYLYYVTRKPIIITEFGYIGDGKTKSNKEKKQYLKDTFGEKFDTEKKIKDNFPEFIEVFDRISRTDLASSKIEEIEYQLKHNFKTDAQRETFLKQYSPYDSIEKMNEDKIGFIKKYEELVNKDISAGIIRESRRIMIAGNYSKESIKEACKFFFRNGKNHLYKTCDSKIGVIGYDHTEEGQAKYLRDFVRRLSKKNYVCGFFVYHFLEDKYCYECSQADCPVETGWGLIKITKGTAEYFEPENTIIKQSYYAIKEVYGELAKKSL